ncbi:hypothetical protein CNR22_22240 [Sphingobacteriaceae bacterium]|nr:hypothetical protein CNR22_22240 [Sphingobacteriaceae bacterium]
MKKTLLTLGFIALISFASNAQDTKKEAKKAPAAKETVNPDGTLIAPEPAPAATEAQTNTSKDQKQQGGTRMAITEKGVPASKKPVEKKPEAVKTEPAKTEKH